MTLTPHRCGNQSENVVARYLLFFAALILPWSSAWGLALGATREEVIEELGQPLAHAQLGSREILTYAKKVRVELEDGRVVSADHLILKIVDPTPSPIPTENPVESEAKITVTAKAAPTSEPLAVPVTPAPIPSSAAAPTPSPAPTVAPTLTPPSQPSTAAPISDQHSSRDEGTASTAASTTSHGTAGASSTHGEKSFHSFSLFDASELPLAGRVMLLALHFAITLMAVYLAFRIWNLDALTSGVVIIAVIDTALHAGFEAMGPMTSGLSTMSAVENGIPAVVMIFTVRQFSFGKKIPEAVRVAALVKVVVWAIKLVATATLLDFVFPVR